MFRITTTNTQPGTMPERLQWTFDTLGELLEAVYRDGADYAQTMIVDGDAPLIADPIDGDESYLLDALIDAPEHFAHDFGIELNANNDGVTWVPLDGAGFRLIVDQRIYTEIRSVLL